MQRFVKILFTSASILAGSACFAVDTTEKIAVAPGQKVSFRLTFEGGAVGGLTGLGDNQQGDRDPAVGSIEFVVPSEFPPGKKITSKQVLIRDKNNNIQTLIFENNLSSLPSSFDAIRFAHVQPTDPNIVLLESVNFATLASITSYQIGDGIALTNGNLPGLSGVQFFTANSFLATLPPGQDPVFTEASIATLPLFSGPGTVDSLVVTAAIPEPEIYMQMMAGVIGLALWASRRRAKTPVGKVRI